MINQSVVRNYQNNQATALSPQETLLLLYGGAIQFLRSATKELEENGDIPRKAKLIEKAVNIIDYLQSCLDMEKGGEIARNLDRLYEYMVIRLTEANLRNEGDKINEVVNLLVTLREGWVAICRGKEASPLPVSPHLEGETCQVKA